MGVRVVERNLRELGRRARRTRSTRARRSDAAAVIAHNRRRWTLEKRSVPLDERVPFVCECTSPGCLSALPLTMLEFEAAHMAERSHAVRPGHIAPADGSRVLVRHAHFWVVETRGR